jgi:uncharacterized cupin superfamily protein
MSDKNYVVRIENDGPESTGLIDWPVMDPSNLVSGQPVQRGHLYDEDETTDYSVGVWDCTAFDDQPGPYPVDEFMLLLEGQVEMVMPGGAQVIIKPGEAFVIPKGLDCQWKMPDTVRKIFMILDGAAPTDADNIALHRITAPLLHSVDTVPYGALATRTTHFVNHDGRMRVHIDTYAAAMHGAAPAPGRHLVHVLNGEVTFSDHADSHFSQGASFYLSPGHDLTWNIAAGTRLLISVCDLASHLSQPST